MSDYPVELGELLEQARREHEPDPGRLDAIYARLQSPAPARAEFDLSPPSPPLRWGLWRVLAGTALASVVALFALSPAASPVHVPLAPPAPATLVEPSRSASLPERVVSAPARPPTPARVMPSPTQLSHARPAPSISPPSTALPPVPSAQARVVLMPPARAAHTAQERAASATQERVFPASRARPRSARTSPRQALEPLALPVETAEQTVEEAPHALEEPESEATEVAPSPRAAAPSVPIRAQKPEPAASLLGEVELMREAQRALGKGDVRAAERALDAHQLQHAVGQLQAERVALRARARCLAGDLVAARELHAQLALLRPRSALLASLLRACPELAGP